MVMIALLHLAATAAILSSTSTAARYHRNPTFTAAFTRATVHRSPLMPVGGRLRRGALLSLLSASKSDTSQPQQPRREFVFSSGTMLAAAPSSFDSVLSPTDHWGNVAVLSLAASLSQLLGRTSTLGKLLGAPVTAMALTFVLSSFGWLPALSPSTWRWRTLLPPGGSLASSFLQQMSLTLATPLLLLGTSLRGRALRQCGVLLGSFLVASLGTLLGAILAFALPIQPALGVALPHGDGLKIAAALVAKNIGGGINYMAVCACLHAAPESVAAGLCVDNVMALLYFPLVSVLASRHGDAGGGPGGASQVRGREEAGAGDGIAEDRNKDDAATNSTSPVEALSHAFTLAALLTAAGRIANSRLHRATALLGRSPASGAAPLDLSLPITTLLAVAFSTYYPPDVFLSPTSSNNGETRSSDVATAGETLGTTCLYLFFATAGAPGWRLRESIQRAFPAIASFLIVLYVVHGAVLWGTKNLVETCDRGVADNERGFWKKVTAPQRLLVASSAAIGGPATAAALARSFEWYSLLTPSLLVGNVGYALATFVGLLFYGVYG